MSETWVRRVLYLAGAWNLIGGATALADPAQHFAQMYTSTLSLEDPLQAFFFRATWINVMAWGAGYILAARLPNARAPILLAGAAGKLAYFAASVSLFLTGVSRTALLAAGILDVIAAVFFVYVVSKRPRPTEESALAAIAGRL